MVAPLILDPFWYTSYPATPTLSVDPVQERVNDDWVRPETARLVGAVGASVSGAASVVTNRELLAADILVAASIALTKYV